MQKKLFDGLLENNAVLIGGMIAAPVIACTDTVQKAAALCYAFSAITILTVFLSALIRIKAPFALRVIVYTLLAALVYIPTVGSARQLFGGAAEQLGIYLPLLTFSSLLNVRSEMVFDRRQSRPRLLLRLLGYCLGFDGAVLLMGVLREFLAYGTIGGNVTGLSRLTAGFSEVWGGFLLLGLLCGLARRLTGETKRKERVLPPEA